MGYSKEVIDLAQEELEERRSKAIAENAAKLELIRRTEPEIYEAEQSVRNTFFSLTKQILGHSGDPEKAVERIEQQNKNARQRVKTLLQAKGYDEDFLTVKYFCPLCKDTGSVEGRSCKCYIDLLKKYASKELSSSFSVTPHSFDEVRKDVYAADARAHMSGIIDRLIDYTDHFNKDTSPSLLLIGGTGTGKTLVSSCIAGELSKRGNAVAFMSAYEIFNRLENEHFGRANSNTLEVVTGCDLLIIDDLGAEFKTSFTEAALYNILNTRINSGKPTLISTNLSSPDLKKLYNERIISRIYGIFKSVTFIGNDLRQSWKNGGIHNGNKNI